MIEKHDIAWWVATLRAGPVSLARYGDGEFLCVAGRSGGNSHGCAYTSELKADLVNILEDTDTNFLKGMQRLEPWQAQQVRPYTDVGRWVDTEIFADALAAGELRPLMEEFRKREDLVIVSSVEKSALIKYFPHMILVLTPRTNAHAEKERILAACRGYLYSRPTATFLFACGMAAGTFVHTLYKEFPEATFLDVGHVFDPFLGEPSRDYLASLDPVILNKNIWNE